MIFAASMAAQSGPAGGATAIPRDLAPPVEDGPFLRPANGRRAEPVWGLRDGISIGLWPTAGPRGLVRIFAPYLDQPPRRMINFVAVEPIVGGGRRGLSELELSERDGVPGKAMWSRDDRTPAQPRDPWDRPSRGRIEGDDGASLTVCFHVEPFVNGARPIIEATLTRSRPYEVDFRVFAADDSAEMDVCVLSATMGNFARVRELLLRDRVVDAREEWPGEEPTTGFAPRRHWGVDDMLVRDGDAVVAVRPDEEEPAAADQSGVPDAWRYVGRPAVQYWRAPAEQDLTVQVNARTTYWGSETPIPGGISFENFELTGAFSPGRSCTFGVLAGTAASLGFDPSTRRGG